MAKNDDPKDQTPPSTGGTPTPSAGGKPTPPPAGGVPTPPPAGGVPTPPPTGGYQPQPGTYPSAGGTYPYPPTGGYQSQPGAYPPAGGYQPQPGAYPPQGGYQPQPGAYPPQGGAYPPVGGYEPQGAYPPAGAYPPQGGAYPPVGAYGPTGGYPPQPPEDNTPANFQLGTKLPPKLNVKAPKHTLHFDEEYFIRLLAGSISLSRDEKKKIVESIPKLKQSQIDELIRIFEEEKQKFAALSKKHVPQLEKLAQQHFEEWMDLENEMVQSEKKAADQGKADEIRKNLGV